MIIFSFKCINMVYKYVFILLTLRQLQLCYSRVRAQYAWQSSVWKSSLAINWRNYNALKIICDFYYDIKREKVSNFVKESLFVTLHVQVTETRMKVTEIGLFDLLPGTIFTLQKCTEKKLKMYLNVIFFSTSHEI